MKRSAVLLAICALMSCHASKQSTSTTAADMRLHDIWALKSLNSRAIRVEDFPRGVPNLELHVADRRAMGFGGCNQFNGSATFERDSIRFGAIAATRMACVGVGNEVESDYFKVLAEPVGYRLDGLQLTLAGKSGVAVFKKVD